MTERSSRRRLRLRRKRKGEMLGPKLSDDGPGRQSGGSTGRFDPTDAGEAVEVVGEFGCCLVEAVGSAAVVLALLTVPAYLMLR